MNKYRITYMQGIEVESDEVEAGSFDYENVSGNLVVYFYKMIDNSNKLISIFNYVISVQLLRKVEQ